jgi:hypothetical protein
MKLKKELCREIARKNIKRQDSRCFGRYYIRHPSECAHLGTFQITKQTPIEIRIKRRKWNWIGHTLRKEAGAIEKTALDWNPQGYGGKGRLKRT